MYSLNALIYWWNCEEAKKYAYRMKFWKISLLAIAAYLVFCMILAFTIPSWYGSKKFVDLLNSESKPYLLVWLNTGDNLAQGFEVSAGDIPLAKGEYFNLGPANHLDEVEYFLFLIEGKEKIPPAHILEIFQITDEEIESAIEGNIVTRYSASSGFRAHLFPVEARYRRIVIMDVSNLYDEIKTDCHREFIIESLFSLEQAYEIYTGCRI